MNGKHVTVRQIKKKKEVEECWSFKKQIKHVKYVVRRVFKGRQGEFASWFVSDKVKFCFIFFIFDVFCLTKGPPGSPSENKK